MATTERLLLPFEDDVPMGYTLERVTLANAGDATDEWIYVLGEEITWVRRHMPELPAHLAERIGTTRSPLDHEKLFVDETGNVVQAHMPDLPPDSSCGQVYRVRFHAGPIVLREQMTDSQVCCPGTVVLSASHMLLVLRPLDEHTAEFINIAELVSDARQRLGWRVATYNKIRGPIMYQPSFLHVHAHDTFVLK